MPLISSPTLSRKKLAANRANAQLSRVPMTLEGLIRMRDSKTKHGAYRQGREQRLRVPAKKTKVEDGMKDRAKGGQAAPLLMATAAFSARVAHSSREKNFAFFCLPWNVYASK